jgi:RHH-type transcriptional regulator, proline utilization regulon repressor / proline dehydrogenase / delta 1-pyrroline-5-carboxylate dehydrogenase
VSLDEFRNEPLLELRRGEERTALAEALTRLEPKLPIEVPALIGHERVGGSDLVSRDPGRPARLVATAALCGEEPARLAVEEAVEGQRLWSRRPAAERAEVLSAAAERLRRRRRELAALEVREAAKPWSEADADVAEAIDFLEYYARAAVRLEAGADLIQVAGERNRMSYRGRGVVAAITPWNFPLAIPAGIVGAGLAAGNAVVLKPAEQTPAMGLALVEALRAAGVPPQAISLVPGAAEAGAALVSHPATATIGFTGSSEVGLGIIRAAAQLGPGQAHVKRVIAEMGGKNAIVVDADADLDEAVPAIARSAFVYAGQKCSACSLVLAHGAIAERLLDRLRGVVDLLAVGPAEGFDTDVPALIDEDAKKRVSSYIERARLEGEVIASAPAPSGPGWFVEPTLVTDLIPGSPILEDEIFGPVLTVEPVESVDAALERVRSMPFALTGGLFSRSPATVERFARGAPVGDLYVNRHITGARVGRQPFGGNRLSGAGLKAGGPDYLIQFCDSHVVSENTMRHGLVPELD